MDHYITAYKRGQRRVPISLLPLLAQTLDTSVDDLIGSPAPHTTRKRGPAPKIQLEQIKALHKAKLRAIAQVLDSMLSSR